MLTLNFVIERMISPVYLPNHIRLMLRLGSMTTYSVSDSLETVFNQLYANFQLDL